MVAFDERKLDAVFEHLDQCHLPGAAVGVAIDGAPVYRKGFGLASMELPVVLSPTMRMRIGSTTKHFTALAYLLLCEDGRAGIDDPIGQHLPELHRSAHAVTMRQLMTNTNGLRDACSIKLELTGIETWPVTSDDLLELYHRLDDVNAAPDSSWIYNNGGWLILSAAIERISGLSLEEFLRRRIFEPVGMLSTLLRRWDTDFVPNSATAHMSRQTGERMRATYGMDNFSGAGAIASTVDDMLRWLRHMREPRVGSVDTWSRMSTPHVLSNGSSTGYGLGLFNERYRGLRIIHHPGGGCGCNAQMLTAPDAGLDIVIMVNREDISARMLALEILNACVLNLEPMRAASGHRPATGVYRSPTTDRVVELGVADGKQILCIDGVDLPAEFDADGVLRPAGASSYLKQVVTLGAATNDLRLDDYGNVDELLRQPPADPADVTGIVGRYWMATIDCEALIYNTPDGARLVTSSRFGGAEFTLECVAVDIWRARTTGPRAYSAVLTFQNDRTFLFSTPSLRSLPFRRVA